MRWWGETGALPSVTDRTCHIQMQSFMKFSATWILLLLLFHIKCLMILSIRTISFPRYLDLYTM